MKVVYGDSVAGYTPTIVRVEKQFVFLETFENLAQRWGGGMWTEYGDKESCELQNVEVWTDEGWTKMYRVIRHMLEPHRKLIRVVTHTGIADVTDEHSLVAEDGIVPIDATCVEVGDRITAPSLPHPGTNRDEHTPC